MNKKVIIKFIIVDIIFIITLMFCVKLYSKNRHLDEPPSDVQNSYIKGDKLKYKHFEISLHNGMEYKTDDYYIFLKSNEGWETKTDIIVDGSSLMVDNPQEVISDLKVRGFETVEGPSEDINQGIYFFYYKANKDLKNHIIAYAYSSIRYVFEVDYTCEKSCDNFDPIGKTFDIFMNSNMEIDQDTDYLFHHFYVR